MRAPDRLRTLTALLCLLPAVAAAEDAAEPGIEGRRIGETLFATMDPSGRGVIDPGDLERFRRSVFEGMDYDGDRIVTYEEFADWDPGFVFVAEEMGRKEAYTTASKIVFAFWDRNGDGGLTPQEMRHSLGADFRRADLDDDVLLTLDEFISGFPIMVAMRAAIRPDL